jgi:hypothetical protein
VTLETEDGDRPGGGASQQFIRRLFRWRRPGEPDLRFGMRLALSGPILFYVVVLLGMLAAQVEGEAGLGLTLAYWLFIGVSQLLYLAPGIAIAVWRGQRTVAKGLALGGVIIAAVDALAWIIGVYVIGAR